MRKHILILAALIILISSCKVIQPYEAQEIRQDLYRDRDTTSLDSTNIAALPWQEMFEEVELQALIEEGLANNLDLKIALTNIEMAEAQLMVKKGAFNPQLDANLSTTASKLANTNPNFTLPSTIQLQYQLFVNASWEADIWGKLKSDKKSAINTLMASKAAEKAIQTRLISIIASSYYSLQAIDQQIIITENTLKIRRQFKETLIALKDASVVTGADLMQNEASIEAAAILLPDLKQQAREIENSLSFLLAKGSDEIERGAFSLDDNDLDLKAGLPSQLLNNRPDVLQAEYQLQAAFEQVNVAQTYFYPALRLTGDAGITGINLGKILNPIAFFSSIAGGIVQPLLNRNVNKARLRSNKASQEQALLNFQSILLTAGQEVSNSMYSYEMANNKIEIRTRQITALKKAVEFNEELLKYNSANYIDVLTAQQNLLSAELNSINDQLQKKQALVEFYRSLGGGWK